jgi:hypothetical protein
MKSEIQNITPRPFHFCMSSLPMVSLAIASDIT